MSVLARRFLPFALAVTLLPGCGPGAAGIAPPPPPPTTGSLAVMVQRLPIGTPAAISVSSPQGFQRSLTQAATISDLIPGSYTIAASSVSSGGVAYTPQPTSQVVAIAAGAAAAATVTYAADTVITFRNLNPGYQARSMVVQGITYNYQIFVPQGYTPAQTWPVILFGHGSGETGSNNTSQITVGLGPYVTAHAATFPAVVVFPQLPLLGTGTPEWLDYRMNFMLQALDETLLEVHADSTRIYYTGVSQGAIFGWGMLYKRPAFFAAAVLISGYINGPTMTLDATTTNADGNLLAAQRLSTLPLWVFHGGADPQVPVALDQAVVAAFRAAGSAIKYTEYPGMGHNVWDITYAAPVMWSWFLSQHR